MINPFSISVLVRTYNSSKTLGSVLDGIVLQLGDEYVVVDSGSTDETLDIARQHGAKIVIAEGSFNYSKSLNLGFRASTNPWVLVISSHSVPTETGFLESHRQKIAHFPDNVIVGYAPSTITGQKNPQLGEKIVFFKSEDFERVAWLMVGNGNSIYRFSAWNELAFDETIQTSEDKLWLKEMIGRGYLFAYLPSPCACARYRGSLSYMFFKGFNDARAARSACVEPMKVIDLAGALKKIIFLCVSRKIEVATSLRLAAAAAGQFFGSHQKYKNSINE